MVSFLLRLCLPHCQAEAKRNWNMFREIYIHGKPAPPSRKKKAPNARFHTLQKHVTTADRLTIFSFLLFPPFLPYFPLPLAELGAWEGGRRRGRLRREEGPQMDPLPHTLDPRTLFPPLLPPPSYSSTRHHQEGRGEKKKTPHCTYTHRTAATNNNTVYTSCTFLGCAVWTVDGRA